jgi:hypothetical protein
MKVVCPPEIEKEVERGEEGLSTTTWTGLECVLVDRKKGESESDSQREGRRTRFRRTDHEGAVRVSAAGRRH